MVPIPSKSAQPSSGSSSLLTARLSRIFEWYEGMVSPTTRGPVPDIIGPGLDILFVGINPGRASARAGRHFAGANAFYRLLYESGLAARPVTAESSRELLEERIGITNLVDRETAGVGDLTAADFARGRDVLTRKLTELRPRAVVFVGVTAYRAFRGERGAVTCGEQTPVDGIRVFVLPNPSGRNAHFTYPRMLSLFREVARALASR